MPQAVRDTLRCVSSPQHDSHAGLWLDAYLPEVGDDGAKTKADVKAEHLKSACRIKLPPGYKGWCDAVRELLEQSPRVKLYELKVQGRLITGIGGATAWENAITLHHTWGTPLIYGSSLKGLAAHFARTQLEGQGWQPQAKVGESRGEAEPNDYELLFGSIDEGGAVEFFDALWMPEGDKLGLEADVITVHHQGYYQGKDEPPADWDSPVPVPFLTVGAGSFVFAMSGPELWVDAAAHILELALRHEGVGAKTSSGYGRMEMKAIRSPAEQTVERVRNAAWPTQPSDLSRLNMVLTLIAEAHPSCHAAMCRALVERVNATDDNKLKKLMRKRLLQKTEPPELLEALPASWQAQSSAPAGGEGAGGEANSEAPAWSAEQVLEGAPNSVADLRDYLDKLVEAQGAPSKSLRKQLSKLLKKKYSDAKTEAETICKSALIKS